MTMSPDDRTSRCTGADGVRDVVHPGAPAPPRRRPRTVGPTAPRRRRRPRRHGERRSPAPAAPSPPPKSDRPRRRAAAGRRAAVRADRSSSDLTELDDDEDDDTPRRPRNASAPATKGSRRRAAPGSERRYRQTVVQVDLWSVTKLSLCFYISAMAVTIVALIALWLIADAAGIINSVEKFFGDLLSAEGLQVPRRRGAARRDPRRARGRRAPGRHHGHRGVLLQHLRRALRRHRDHRPRRRGAPAQRQRGTLVAPLPGL